MKQKALGVFILICSCKNIHHEPSVNRWLMVFEKLAAEKKYSAALNLADQYLLSIKDLPDSTISYIRTNAFLYDSAIRWGINKYIAEKYYQNIITKKDIVQYDSTLGKYLATAYYRTGNNHFSLTEYNDTTVSAWENYLLLKEKLQLIQLQREAYVNMRLGIQYNIVGDIKKSLKHYSLGADEYLLSEDNDNYVACVNNKAIAFNELKLFDSSINNIKSCYKIPGIAAGIKALQLAMLADAELQNGLLKDSKQHIDEGLGIINSIPSILYSPDILDRKSQIYFVKYKIENAENNIDRSFQFLKESAKMEQLQSSGAANPRQFAKRLLALGFRYKELRQYDTASVFYHLALKKILNTVDSSSIFSLPSPSQLYAENTIQEALDAKASAFQQLYLQKPDIKYLSTAVQCYTLSFEVERKLMQYFSYDESKLLMLKESRQRSQQAIGICYQLYQLTKNKEWAEKAFLFAEKNKAFVLLESVKRNLAANRSLQEDTLYQRTQSLQLQLAYNERSMAATINDSARKKLAEQKNKLENDLLFANTALARQSTAYKTAMEQEDSISTGIVSSFLPDKQTGLMEFFSSDSGTYAFVINKDQAVQFIRYNSSLSATIDSLLLYFQNPTAITNKPVGYRQTAYKLYTDLGLDKMSSNWQDLIIIPDGKLSFVPFDALVTTAGTTINLQEVPWFINKCNTVYGYSAGILLKQLHNREVNNKAIAVFAPVFAHNENGQQSLINSRAEAEEITANKNATVFLAGRATLGNFKDQFAKAGILHIATHAYADTGSNSNPKIEFIDSSLLLNELYALHTNASLIVLSACETGIGQLNKSEGPMSLARGFYYAGAKNIITSYWSVDDKSTAVLFSLFYKNISGQTSADALCNAKKEFIKNVSASFASPYYWAGFVHFGIPKKKEIHNYWWWLLLLPGIIAFRYWIRRK
jgi:CHAT domain-containing protein